MPNLLILADDNYVDMLEAGYDVDYNQQMRLGNIKAINTDKAKELCDQGVIQSALSTKEMFVLNPYRKQYLSIAQSDLGGFFIDELVWAVKHALTLLGARAVIFSERVGVNNKESDTGNLKADGALAGVNGSVSLKQEGALERMTELQFYKPKNTPFPLDKIKEHLVNTGLYYSGPYKGWLEVLEMGRDLDETMSLKVEYSSSLKSSFDLAVQLNVKFFHAGLNFEKTSEHIHTFKKTLKVYFGDVPQEVVEMINS